MAGRFPFLPTETPTLPPWLLLPHGDDDAGANKRLLFVEVLTGERHVRLLPEPFTTTKWRCRGSSHGWLAILDLSPNVVVLNPLSHQKLSLPPLSTLPPVTGFDDSDEEYKLAPGYSEQYGYYGCSYKEMRDLFIQKIVLTDCPKRNPNFTALAIFFINGGHGNLACCKSGQDRWTMIPGMKVDDAVCFQGKVYTVKSGGWIHTCDVNTDPPSIEKMEMIGPEVTGETPYLVPAWDELFIVFRSFDSRTWDVDATFRTQEFKVFRLSSCENGKKRWERVHDLGDRAFFLGANSCPLVLKASGFPNCKGNSIYFTDDYADLDYDLDELPFPEEHDVGRFCLDDKSVNPLPHISKDRSDFANPIWLSPNPFHKF